MPLTRATRKVLRATEALMLCGYAREILESVLWAPEQWCLPPAGHEGGHVARGGPHVCTDVTMSPNQS